ncbi:hypothetical protein BLNAU_15290 [Blattamonas nauphoetae]|uniref:Uncharacterized protein n=1 Tax=Blattamonas nauphoetae TaxID=2049346 RepID=A0ABQ9XB98_9EUKA|nr:hypothetical protein BLNAU_15290 [Blattamonas nauphoetae]
MTSDSHFARTLRQNVKVAQIDGKTKLIPMIKFIAELFGAYLNRLRAQIGQIHLLWTTEPEHSMLLDKNISTCGTDTSEHLDVATLTTQITATCEVLKSLSHFFDSAVFWDAQRKEMPLDYQILRLFGEFFSFYCETVEHENSLQKQNPTIELSWMDSRTMVKEGITYIVPVCLNGMRNLLLMSKFMKFKIYETIYPQHRPSDEHFFSVLSTLLAFRIPDLAFLIARIMNVIVAWKQADYPTLLKSGLIEVLFRYVIAQGIDDEQTEKNIMQIASVVLIGGEKGYFKYYQPRMIDRDSAHRLCCLLAQSNFVTMMENRSQQRAEEWTKELGKLRSRCSEYETRLSNLSSAFSIDCIPFLSWTENYYESWFGQTVVFQSLVATRKIQPALDVSLEAKATQFLESLTEIFRWSPDDLLSAHVSHSDGSLTDFVQSIVVLISSPNQVIKTATMKMLNKVVVNCSAIHALLLIKADLIDQLLVTLNPLSLSFADAVDIHSKLMSIIHWSVLLTTPDGLKKLKIEDPDEQQALCETVLKQGLAPSSTYLCYLCAKYHSIIEGDMSTLFMTLLSQLLQISSHSHQTMEYVLTLPVFLATSSCLSFFETDSTIDTFLSSMIDPKSKRNEQSGDVRESEMTILRSLRMEGIDDVIEEKLVNDRSSDHANRTVVNTIKWSNMLGMNHSEYKSTPTRTRWRFVSIFDFFGPYR